MYIGRAAQIGSGGRRLENGLLLGVMRGRRFVGVARECLARAGHDDGSYAVGGRTGRAAAAQPDGSAQVVQVLLRVVGMQRVGRDLHPLQFAALPREAAQVEGRFEPRGGGVADAYGGIDRHAQRVDEFFVQKHAERTRTALNKN